MKKILKLITCIILAASMMLSAVLPASAARPGTQFLSEIHLAEAKDAATAKKMLTDNGYTVLDKNLNPGGDSVVYLGYKTSSNVEDAITDISVMNMHGGYRINDYENMLKETFDEYRDLVQFFRTAANEFAANYNAGKKEALLAYRQLNYYYIGEGENKVLMGDYLLDFPEKDDDFAEILMKGNVNILNNLRSLLAMGVSKGGIIERANQMAKDPEVYSKVEYYDLAKMIHGGVASLESIRIKFEQNIAEIQSDDTLTDEEKDLLIALPAQSLVQIASIELMLTSLDYKDTNCYEYVTSKKSVDYSVYYPLIAVMTEGQKALTKSGQFISVLVYDEVDLSADDIEEKLSDIESKYSPQSVFLGTDMELFDGSFAVTEGAINRESSTGVSWLTSTFGNVGATIASTVLTVAGAVITAISATYLAVNIAHAPTYIPEGWVMHQGLVYQFDPTQADDFIQLIDDIDIIEANQATLRQQFAAAGGGTHVPAQVIIASTIGLAVGVAMLSFGIYSIVKIVNGYNVEYTDIPINMVENVSTANGDRYIRYRVVNSYYEDDGVVKERAGDTNAYAGKQWNAIYYTKSYEAGKCMLATFDWPSHDTDFGKYAPVHPFGEKDVCYNLNDFSDGGDEDSKIYLALRTSNAKKAADSSVPQVVGSLFSFGIIAITGVAGIGVGMGIAGITHTVKKKKAQNA